MQELKEIWKSLELNEEVRQISLTTKSVNLSPLIAQAPTNRQTLISIDTISDQSAYEQGRHGGFKKRKPQPLVKPKNKATKKPKEPMLDSEDEPIDESDEATPEPIEIEDNSLKLDPASTDDKI